MGFFLGGGGVIVSDSFRSEELKQAEKQFQKTHASQHALQSYLRRMSFTFEEALLMIAEAFR